MGWQRSKLSELCSIQTGRKDVNSGSASGKYPFFTCAKEHTFSDEYSFDCEALLIAGNGVVGNTSYYNGKFEAYQRTYVLSDFVNVLPRFLFLLLDGVLKDSLVDKKLGNTMPYIKVGMLKDFIVPLPPIPEQQRIVAILDQAFADIEKARANAEKNLKNAHELFDNYLNQVFSQRGEGWVEKPLGDVICKTLTTDPRKKPELKFLYVDVSSVSNTALEITEATELLGKDAPSRARRVISEGNVIFATVRPTLKRIAIVPNRLDGEICSTGYFVFNTSDELYNRYLYYFLQSYYFMDEMEKLQSGASYPAVNDSQVKQTIIKYPSITEQKSIVASLDKLSEKVQQLEKGYQEKLDSLDKLKKSFLQKAFSGELTKTKGHAA